MRPRPPSQMPQFTFANVEQPTQPDELTPILATIDSLNQNALIVAMPVEGVNFQILIDAQVRGDVTKQPRPRTANCLCGALFRNLVQSPGFAQVFYAQIAERLKAWEQFCSVLQKTDVMLDTRKPCAFVAHNREHDGFLDRIHVENYQPSRGIAAVKSFHLFSPRKAEFAAVNWLVLSPPAFQFL